MNAATETRTDHDDDGAAKAGADGRAPRVQPSWSTSLLHTSGLLLAVLLFAHVLELFILHDIQSETAQTFADRWSNPVWRGADWALLVLALVHGTVGMRSVIGTGVRNDKIRGAILAALYVLVGVLLALVSFVAFTMEFRFN